jgi:hypothetical protein
MRIVQVRIEDAVCSASVTASIAAAGSGPSPGGACARDRRGKRSLVRRSQ